MARRMNVQGIALAALVGGALAIALAPIFVKISEIGPGATAFHRMLLSLPFLALPLVWRQGQDTGRRARTRRDVVLLFLAGAFFAGDLAVWHWSITLTSVANATLFANAAPIFVAITAWFLLGERFGAGFVIGLGVAMAGTVMVVGASFGGQGNVLGDALGLLTALFYAGYLICVKLLRNAVGTIEIMLWSGVVAAPILLAVALASGESLWATTATGWAILFGLALVSHAFGQSLIAFALAHLAASFSSVTLLIQPMTAAFLAWLLLGEALTGLQAAGGIAVLMGVFVARQSTLRAEGRA